jgi:hypothetical protein
MRQLLALLLIVSMAQAQSAFGPLCVDDTTVGSRSYPDLQSGPGADLWCMWSHSNLAQHASYGRRLSPAGELAAESVVFEEGPPGNDACPPNTQVLPLPGGGEVRLIEHR